MFNVIKSFRLGGLELNKNQDDGLTQARNKREIKQVHAIAIYDPTDGRIHHMHHVLITEGARPPDASSFEKDALVDAEKFGHKVANLKMLHVKDLNLKDINAKYRVDTEKNVLVKISEQDQNFRDILSRKKSSKPGM
jgi:hypothetical protein